MKKTQEAKVLGYLRSHKRGTNVREIFTKLNINSPTKVISILRESGHNIVGTRVDVLDEDGKCKSHYIQYTLEEKK